MQQLNIYEVKTHFSKLVEQAHNGETIIIAKAGKPWAKTIPFDTPTWCGLQMIEMHCSKSQL